MMMRSWCAGTALRQLGPVLFASAPAARAAAEPAYALLAGASAAAPAPTHAAVWLVRFPLSRAASTLSAPTPAAGQEGETAAKGDVGVTKKAEGATEQKEVLSYWGVPPSRVTKEDGSPWRWACFRPWETYEADLSIDLKKHHTPTTFLDKMAFWTVKVLRLPTDLFFQRRYGCRAMMLETVAAVPGMVGGMLLHLKSLRRFEQSGGWIKALLEEAENERMHLMTFMEVSHPRWYERALVLAVQGVFFNAYFVGYMLSPKFAHRVVGYLEEEAIHSYTEFLKEIDKGTIENVPAPAIALDYWRLPPGSTLRDVVMVIRADEAHHRDVNHFASDVHYQGRQLKEAPAPERNSLLKKKQRITNLKLRRRAPVGRAKHSIEDYLRCFQTKECRPPSLKEWMASRMWNPKGAWRCHHYTGDRFLVRFSDPDDLLI
ncbi:hypothetical protein Taro_038225 [Colocasia esculenta]|uniref:Ubiquinol oxidase n=1 Tax=Colocasia esculenta TaxID=4460 RepID=A0A843WN28_COLES|nr:hypothetical protein [Colocasia esculenta]